MVLEKEKFMAIQKTTFSIGVNRRSVEGKIGSLSVLLFNSHVVTWSVNSGGREAGCF